MKIKINTMCSYSDSAYLLGHEFDAIFDDNYPHGVEIAGKALLEVAIASGDNASGWDEDFPYFFLNEDFEILEE